MWGAGQAPSSWTTVNEGESNGTVTNFGTINLEAVREALASYVVPPDPGGPTFAVGEPEPVPARIHRAARGQRPAHPADRHRPPRVQHLQGLEPAPGFPKQLGAGGESPTRYADLDGNDVQELIVPTEDGYVHALRTERQAS